jgi:hypothetical protein
MVLILRVMFEQYPSLSLCVKVANFQEVLFSQTFLFWR